MSKKNDMSRRENFRKKLAIGLTVAGVAVAGTNLTTDKSLSLYDAGTDRYMDYIDDSEVEKHERMTKLDDNINRYEELSNKVLIDKEEKEELKEISEYLKKEMSSGYLEKFYLQDLLKDKLKQAYNRDRDDRHKITNIETRWHPEEGITIKMYDKYKSCTIMDKKDKVAPIRNAMNDIAKLQYYESKDQFSNLEIKEFIRIQRDMKGFSNLIFIKKDDKPLQYSQIDLEKSEDIEL